jgi:hypothetical protein
MALSDKVIRQSVQKLPKADENGAYGGDYWFGYVKHPAIIGQWGVRAVDHRLREIYYAPHNAVIQGVVANLAKQVASMPWEISQGKQLVRHYQEVLQEAHFGAGWRDFVLRFLADYLTQNNGAWWEIIGPGNPDSEIRGMVNGVAHLDSGRTVATGDPKYPAAYVDKDGNLHRLHKTRVVRIVDMPTSIELKWGMGLCALYRAVGLANKQMLMSKYENEKLTNLPPEGLLSLSNIKGTQFQDATRLFHADEARDGNSVWRRIQYVEALDPEKPIEINFEPFSQLPDHFDKDTSMRWDVNLIAQAFGIDVQDIAPLTGQALGTGTQSQILHTKGRGKALADLLKIIERVINLYVLPPSLEFEFKHRDGDLDKETAENAQLWIDVANAATFMDDTMKAQLVANQVPAVKDIITGKDGLIRLPDVDIQPEPEEINLDDDTNTEGDTEPGETPDGEDDNLQQRTMDTDSGWPNLVVRTKDFEATVTQFRERAETFIFALARDKDRRRFGTSMRRVLRQQGQQAYLDGLETGGVKVDKLPDEDKPVFNGWLVDQSGFVTALSKSIMALDDPEALNVSAKVELWVNKSLTSAFQFGVLSADRNGMYEFAGDDGLESCHDCKRLKGQVHRLKDWHRTGWLPQSDKLECKGYRCEHRLKRVKAKARGKF